MNDELLKKYAAETEEEMRGRFANPAEVSDEATGTEEAMIETEPMEMEPVNAEIIENTPPAAMPAAGLPPLQLFPMMSHAYQPQNWMPWPQYPITAQGVFDLALTVVPIDPARLMLRFFYETQLKRECNMLIPHPIPSYYPQGIRNALSYRRSNPTVFVCQAIDVVLTYFLKDLNLENDNDIF